MNLSKTTIKYLECKALEELKSVYGDYNSFRDCLDDARKYLRECPMEELPKYINHPSALVKNILSLRFKNGE